MQAEGARGVDIGRIVIDKDTFVGAKRVAIQQDVIDGGIRLDLLHLIGDDAAIR